MAYVYDHTRANFATLGTRPSATQMPSSESWWAAVPPEDFHDAAMQQQPRMLASRFGRPDGDGSTPLRLGRKGAADGKARR